jgi:hypothetical protein
MYIELVGLFRSAISEYSISNTIAAEDTQIRFGGGLALLPVSSRSRPQLRCWR